MLQLTLGNIISLRLALHRYNLSKVGRYHQIVSICQYIILADVALICGCLLRQSQGLGNRLLVGQELIVGEQLVSTRGNCVFRLQQDGDLVLYERSPEGKENALLSSNTEGGKSLRLKQNGNLVLKNTKNKKIWDLKTAGKGGVKLVLNNSCNLTLLKANGNLAWSTSISNEENMAQEAKNRKKFFYRSAGRCWYCYQDDDDM